MYCFVILLLFNEMQMSVRRFSAIPHLRACFDSNGFFLIWRPVQENTARKLTSNSSRGLALQIV